jgi:type II secretory pathway component PulJ
VRKHSKNGFTFLEALLSLFLFAVTLVVISKLVTGSQRLIRHSAGRSQALKASQWALADIRHQVEAAATLNEPVTGSSDKLKLTVFRTDLAGRLPDPVPNWRPGKDPWWDPNNATYLESLEYRLQGDQLVRSVGGLGQFLAENMESFKVENLDDQLQIELVVKESTKTSRFISRVRKP